MGKEDPCEVCGGTETKLVDGFYYCVECGTQDTKLQETIVEGQLLADGTFAISRRTKYSVKIKEGVEMSLEWYKWHKLNFMLAGLTEQLIELGAAPSLRMKVLWMWTRYVRKHQKKDDFNSTKVLNQLEATNSSSDSDASEAEVLHEGRGPRTQRRGVDRYLLLALLALGLTHDRSPLQVSHLTRFVMFRMLTVNDTLRFVPRELARRTRERDTNAVTTCCQLRARMMRLARSLELGPGPAPDVEALLAAQLAELRLPRTLAPLVRALVDLAPVSWRVGATHGREPTQFPSYETTVLAYILVALKMCFGLDDDYEARLSAAVDGVNSACGHPRAADDEPAPTARLFSFREWSAHLQLRRLVLGRLYAPLAWLRNSRTTDYALLEHFEEITTVWAPRRNRNTKLELSDQVTMDVINKIPRAQRPETEEVPPSLAELRPAAAAPTPQLALTRLLAPRLRPPRRALLQEDFTQYSLEYATRRRAPPQGSLPSSGVSAAGKEFRKDLRGRAQLRSRAQLRGSADATIVFVKDCCNKNWTRTRRPTARHVLLGAGEGDGDGDGDGEGDEVWDPAPGHELETFEEEAEGRSIFDDDFLDTEIKEEKPDFLPDPPASDDRAEYFADETKDNVSWGDFESTRRPSEAAGASPGPCAAAGGVFDSDEEAGPEFDPATFNRADTIKELMVALYTKYKIHSRHWHPRYKLGAPAPPKKKIGKPRTDTNKYRRLEDRKFRNREKTMKDIGVIVAAYESNMSREPLFQLQQRVQDFEDSAGLADTTEPLQDSLPEPAGAGAGAGAEPGAGVAADDSRDVELIDAGEDKDKVKDSDSDSWDGPAYDPVFKGDENFDEETHDPAQLFLRLPAAPAPARAYEHFDAATAKLLDEKSRLAYAKKVTKKTTITAKDNIDHLVADPEGITEFNYWFKHYPWSYIDSPFIGDLEIEQHLPASFRFVLLEGAAMLGAPPNELYYRMCDVERAMLKHLPIPKRKIKKKKSKKTTARKAQVSKRSDDASVSQENHPGSTSTTKTKRKKKSNSNKASPVMRKTPKSKNTRAQKHPTEISDDVSDSAGSEVCTLSHKYPEVNVSKKIRVQKDRVSRTSDDGSHSEASRRDESESQEVNSKKNSKPNSSSKTTKTVASRSRKRKNEHSKTSESSDSRKTTKTKCKKARIQKELGTSDESSDSEESVSDDSSVSQEDAAGAARRSTPRGAPAPGASSPRRSGRLRQKEAHDPFWR